MTLTGTDTVANYQTALESVTYTDTSENPSTAARTVTFTADDGQAVNHQSAGSNHTITVASVDDAPTVTVPGAQDSVSAHTDFAITGISTNDVDAGSQAVKVSLGTTHGNITLDLSGGATLADATTNGTHSVHITGTLTQVNAALSSVVYHGDAGFTGTDALTVQTNDLGHTGTGGPLTSSVATVDIGVIPKVWFIDNTASAVGADGSQAHPFNSIAAFNAVNDGGASHPQTGDYVYLTTGTGVYSEADGIHLLNGQQLVGGGDGLTFPDPLNNANTLTIETAGTRPVIDVTGAGNDAIHLAQDNTIHGFNVATENAAATGIVDNGGTVGTLNISNMDVGVDPDGAGALHGNLGQAISITHGGTAGTMTFGTVNSAGGTTRHCARRPAGHQLLRHRRHAVRPLRLGIFRQRRLRHRQLWRHHRRRHRAVGLDHQPHRRHGHALRQHQRRQRHRRRHRRSPATAAAPSISPAPPRR